MFVELLEVENDVTACGMCVSFLIHTLKPKPPRCWYLERIRFRRGPEGGAPCWISDYLRRGVVQTPFSLSLVSTDPGLPAHQEAGSHQTLNVGDLELGPPNLQD